MQEPEELAIALFKANRVQDLGDYSLTTTCR